MNDNDFSFQVDEIPEEGLKVQLNIPAALFVLINRNKVYGIRKNVDIQGKLLKQNNDILFEAEIRADMTLNCARCTMEFVKFIRQDLNIIFKQAICIEDQLEFDKLHIGNSRDIATFNGKNIDIIPLVRDYISLSVPIKPLCSDECKGLCTQCGFDLNVQNCQCKTEKTDPRFEILRTISFDK